MAGTFAMAEAHVHMTRAPVPGEPRLSCLPSSAERGGLLERPAGERGKSETTCQGLVPMAELTGWVGAGTRKKLWETDVWTLGWSNI